MSLLFTLPDSKAVHTLQCACILINVCFSQWQVKSPRGWEGHLLKTSRPVTNKATVTFHSGLIGQLSLAGIQTGQEEIWKGESSSEGNPMKSHEVSLNWQNPAETPPRSAVRGCWLDKLLFCQNMVSQKSVFAIA